jgi:hypothetical protein
VPRLRARQQLPLVGAAGGEEALGSGPAAKGCPCPRGGAVCVRGAGWRDAGSR